MASPVTSPRQTLADLGWPEALTREPLKVIATIAQAAAARAPSASKSSVYGWSVASATGA
jgi:hypothetical protein